MFSKYKILTGAFFCLSSIIFLTLNNQTFAAGFASELQSASGLGNSYAGVSTGAHDISDIFYNPANLSDVKSNNILVSAGYINADIDADNSSGTFPDSTKVNGSRSGDAGVDATLPAFYLAMPVNKKMVFGFDVTVPFGLATSYDKNWIGRYHAIDSDIKSLNINPMISYLITDQFSVGGGLQAQYFSSTLTKAADLGLLSGTPGSNDGLVKAKGNDLGYGFNLGAKYKINDQFKFGVGYRSQIKHKIKGDVTLTSGNVNNRSTFNSPITTPETVTFGAAYKINQKFELLYDTNWSRWSRIQSIDILSPDPNLSGSTPFKWKDSWKYSLGLNYKANNKWLVRTGTALERDAVNNAYRNPSLPTSNRVWISIGTEYKINNDMKIDTAYVHQFYKKSSSNLAGDNKTASLQTDYNVRVDIVAVSLMMAF